MADPRVLIHVAFKVLYYPFQPLSSKNCYFLARERLPTRTNSLYIEKWFSSHSLIAISFVFFFSFYVVSVMHSILSEHVQPNTLQGLSSKHALLVYFFFLAIFIENSFLFFWDGWCSLGGWVPLANCLFLSIFLCVLR